jgi:hypothetical protein
MKPFAVLIGLLVSLTLDAQSAHRKNDGTHPCPPGGKATTEPELRETVVSMDQLLRMSELIIDGSVTQVFPSVGRSPNLPEAIETHSLLSVAAILSGALPSGTSSIVLVQEGGKTAQCEEVVADDPLVKEGERYLLFLDQDNRKQPPNSTGSPRYYTVGLWSGKAQVLGGKITFLARAHQSLHTYDNTEVDAFTSMLTDRIKLLFPKRLP